MKFLSSYSDIKIAHSDLKEMIEFQNGQFETTDKKEIDIIKKSNMFGASIWEDKEKNEDKE